MVIFFTMVKQITSLDFLWEIISKIGVRKYFKWENIWYKCGKKNLKAHS